ncbi:MAG: hypothetical protein GYB66_07250 [Chloroflexi bacterium]|nr:hypothetical protein [Chloroflexota bacterium]
MSTTTLWFIRFAFGVVAVAVITLEIYLAKRQSRYRISAAALGGVAVANILFVCFVLVNQIGFPLHLDLMEGTVLQHYERAANFEAIYPEPTPEYVPLAYNPLYYVISVPIGWVFGTNLFTLRLVATLGMVGSAFMIYRIVSEKTASRWWGLIAIGLFAAAYRVMDAYLNTAHSDSWFLFSALMGSYIIDRNWSRNWNLAGVGILAAAFWFKQHGALFAIGGVLFLTWREVRQLDWGWRDGIQRSIPYWLLAGVLGPTLYVFGGPWLFGEEFHYFTWEVPRGWSELTLGAFFRYGFFIARNYLAIAAASGLFVAFIVLRDRKKLNIWHVQFVFAMLSGFMGTLDPGSADNVYIPMGTWFIVVGTIGLHELEARIEIAQQYRVAALAVAVTFALFIYDFQSVVVSPNADESYDDFTAMLENLHGPIYAPWQGHISGDYNLYPNPHWVALEDMIRGPGRDTRNHPNTRRLLEPAIHPNGAAYILTNKSLDTYAWIEFLEDYYVLEQDFEDRFEPLRTTPKRFNHAYPRYLYRYDPEKATHADECAPDQAHC